MKKIYGLVLCLALLLNMGCKSPVEPAFSTIFRYEVRYPAFVSLKIYTAVGYEIITLVEKDQAPGYYTVRWDGKNNKGEKVVEGIYFYVLRVKYADDDIYKERMRFAVK